MNRLSILLVLLLLAACGGGGGGSSASLGGGTGGTGIVRGAVDGFGSVIVNGIEFDTDMAQIYVDGQPATQADLSVGMLVRVEGEFDSAAGTGTAENVYYSDDLTGPVSSIDTAAKQIVIFGQTVQVGLNTYYSGQSFNGLADVQVGQILEVSGDFDADGVLQAKYLEKKADDLASYGEPVQASGTISNVAGDQNSFDLAGVQVNVLGGTVFEDMVKTDLADGLYVKVTGDFAGGQIDADEIDREDSGAGGSDGDEVEWEGLITNVAGSQLTVSGQVVLVDAGTRYEGGNAVDLVLGARIEVEGTLNAGGQLVAEEIEFENEGEVRAVGTIEQLNAGEVVVLGTIFAVDSDTAYDDNRDDLQPFGFGDLAVGDWVELRATDQSGTLVVDQLVRVEAQNADEYSIRGRVTQLSNPNLEIQGLSVTTDGGTDFEDETDTSIDAATFFATTSVDDIVEAKGTYSGSGITAVEVEQE